MDRGTVTVLSTGQVVVGVPTEFAISRERIEEIVALLKQWQAGGNVLVLGFPVDVVDLRTTTERTKEDAEFRRSKRELMRSGGSVNLPPVEPLIVQPGTVVRGRAQ